MGTYIYRLAKKSEALDVAHYGTVGMLVFAYKPWRTWDGEAQNDRWQALAENAVNRSWGDTRPAFATMNPTADDRTPDAIEMIGAPVIHWDPVGGTAQSTIADSSLQFETTIGYLRLDRGVWVVGTKEQAKAQLRLLCHEMGHGEEGSRQSGDEAWKRYCTRCDQNLGIDVGREKERYRARVAAEGRERVRNLSPLEFFIEKLEVWRA